MTYISIDVNSDDILSELDDEDLIEEIGRRKFTDDQKRDIIRAIGSEVVLDKLSSVNELAEYLYDKSLISLDQYFKIKDANIVL